MGHFFKETFLLFLLFSSSLSKSYDGVFKILSYNVGGLPEIISSSKP